MIFWIIASLMVALALGLVAVPLRATRRTVVLLLVSTSLVTWGLYRELGAPAILEVDSALQGKSHDADAMLAALEKRLKAKPDDAEGWFVLGRAYLTLQRLADAEAAAKRAVDLAPKEAKYLSHYAEILAMADQGNLQKRARALFDEALELDPQEEKALELAGLAAFQREEWAQAAFYWRHLLKRLPPGSEFYQDVEAALKKARGRAEHAAGLSERGSAGGAEKQPDQQEKKITKR